MHFTATTGDVAASVSIPNPFFSAVATREERDRAEVFETANEHRRSQGLNASSERWRQ